MAKQTQFSDPFADVEVQPVSVAGENVPTRVAVRVKNDEHKFELAGIVGRDYQLLPNRKVRDVADDIMSRCDAKLGGFRNLKTLFDGKRYVDYFVSHEPIAALNGDPQKDGLQLGLMVWNSYDGSRKVGFEVFALNPYCTNQYHSRNRFGFFAWRHQPGDNGASLIDVDDALDGIGRGVNNIIQIAPKIGDLRKRELTIPMLTKAKAEITLPQTRWGDVLDALKDEQPNAFGLYQALTNVASHKLTGLNAVDVGSDITDWFLDEQPQQVMNHTTAAEVVGAR